MTDFAERCVLVTGANQGLGREIARFFAEAGARVIINDIADGEAVAEKLRGEGLDVEFFQCDISDEKAVREMFAGIGPVDVLVNNARIDPYFRKPEMSEKEWFMKSMEVNVFGAYITGTVFLEQAGKRKFGRIVNMSSSRAYTPAEPHMVAYNISKLALHALSRSFAAQGATYGITANTVAPGFIGTENVHKRLDAGTLQKEMDKIPLKRAAEMCEVAEAVFFAASSGYITGEVININGGQFYTP